MQGRNHNRKSPSLLSPSPLKKSRSPNKTILKIPDTQREYNKMEQSIRNKKHLLINDEEHNSMIYEWRKREEAPIVKVFALGQHSEMDGRRQEIIVRNVVKVETIVKRLTEMDELSTGESLYILKSMLKGHEAIFKKLGATSISLDKCGINENGELKVWINHHFQFNEMSGEILSSETRIVSRIFEVINLLTDSKLESFKFYVFRNIQYNEWSFYLMESMIKSYVQSLRIQLPSCIRGTEENQKACCSSTGNKKPLEMRQRCASSYQEEVENRNTQSLVNFSMFSGKIPGSQKNSVNLNEKLPSSIKHSVCSTKYTANSLGQSGCQVEKKRVSCFPSLYHITEDNSMLRQSEYDTEKELAKTLRFKIVQQYSYCFFPQKKQENGKSIISEVSTNYRTSSNNESTFMKKYGRYANESHHFDYKELKEEHESSRNSEKSGEEKEVSSSEILPCLKEKNTNLLGLVNREVAFSTYLENGSEKCLRMSSPRKKNLEIVCLEEGLNRLLMAAKETEIIENNRWSKKIEGLLNINDLELKESINYEGVEKYQYGGEMKPLRKCGRDVARSVIPE